MIPEPKTRNPELPKGAPAPARNRRVVRRSRVPRWWLAQATKKAPALLLLLWTLDFGLWTGASASTITGTLLNTSGNPYVTNALFAPLSHAVSHGQQHHRLHPDQ